MSSSHIEARLTTQHWLRAFLYTLKELEKESFNRTDAEWTKFMEKVMDSVAVKTKCYAAMRRARPKDDEYSGEYLNIDALFFALSEYNDWESKDWDPPVLPSAAIELENDYHPPKITYCLWKLLCVRTHLRVLACYQDQSDKIESLRTHLERVISEKRLMERSRLSFGHYRG